MKLLIAYDGTPGGEAVLEDLRRAGLPAEGEADVVSVADVLLIDPASDAAGTPEIGIPLDVVARARNRDLAELEQAKTAAARAAARVGAVLPRWTIRGSAAAGNPGWEIVKYSDAGRHDLIFVGSRGRGRLARAVLGSVSDRVLRSARCSVRIARAPDGTRKRSLRLLVGVDGSAHGDAAVAAAAARSWPHGTKAVVVCAYDTVISGALPWADDREGPRRALQHLVDQAAERLGRAGVDATGVLIGGDPRQVLLREAERGKADCIFIGARGLGAVERFVLGSVSSAVASRARCSVEVVRSPSPR